MALSSDHIENMRAILGQHGMSGKLGFHLLHQHDTLPDGQIKLETRLETVPNGKWSQPVWIEGLDPNNIHGTLFKLDRGDRGEGRLVPFEFAKGPPSICKGSYDCMKDFSAYITEHNLDGKIALQVLDPVQDGQSQEPTAEFELGTKNGTLALPVSMVKNPDLLPTGWSCAAQQSNDPEPGPGPNKFWEKRVVKDKETHMVYVSHAEDEKELLEELVRHDVINI